MTAKEYKQAANSLLNEKWNDTAARGIIVSSLNVVADLEDEIKALKEQRYDLNNLHNVMVQNSKDAENSYNKIISELTHVNNVRRRFMDMEKNYNEIL